MHALDGEETENLENFGRLTDEQQPVANVPAAQFRYEQVSGWTYTPKQVFIFQKLGSFLSVLDRRGGSGKTTILVSLALWMTNRSQEGSRGCLNYMTETQEMVNEFLQRGQEICGISESIEGIGQDGMVEVD